MKRSSDFVVGIVVIGTVAAIVAVSLFLSQASLGRRHRDVVARFRDVGNAKVGNSVVIRGVQSGRIQAIELSDVGWVEVRMRLAPDVTLPEDPVVILNESSMFGEWQATIMSRSAAPENRDVRQQLADAEGGPRGALPGARLPDIAQLTAVAGRIAGDVSSVAERFQVAFDDRAAHELRESIRNFSVLSAELARTVRAQSDNLEHVSRDVRRTVTSVDATADALRRTAARVDSATDAGTVQRIVGNVSDAAMDLRETSRQLRGLSGSLAESQERLASVLVHTDSVMRKIDRGDGSLGLLVNDPGLYRHSDSLVVQMRELVTEIKAHPKKYLSLRIF
ncbi:MAG TPA: MlaD family protein [Gemmatimonadaceae bacterium]